MPNALFLDRDGTLIFDKHYLADPAQVEIIPGVPDALRRARSMGYQLFLFTNQSGIARGLHTLDDVTSRHRNGRHLRLGPGAVLVVGPAARAERGEDDYKDDQLFHDVETYLATL